MDAVLPGIGMSSEIKAVDSFHGHGGEVCTYDKYSMPIELVNGSIVLLHKYFLEI